MFEQPREGRNHDRFCLRFDGAAGSEKVMSYNALTHTQKQGKSESSVVGALHNEAGSAKLPDRGIGLFFEY
jgi:hypothetical protein